MKLAGKREKLTEEFWQITRFNLPDTGNSSIDKAHAKQRSVLIYARKAGENGNLRKSPCNLQEKPERRICRPLWRKETVKTGLLRVFY